MKRLGMLRVINLLVAQQALTTCLLMNACLCTEQEHRRHRP